MAEQNKILELTGHAEATVKAAGTSSRRAPVPKPWARGGKGGKVGKGGGKGGDGADVPMPPTEHASGDTGGASAEEKAVGGVDSSGDRMKQLGEEASAGREEIDLLFEMVDLDANGFLSLTGASGSGATGTERH